MLSATRPIALATALASAALLAGCGGSDDSAGNGRSAVAAFYPLAWVTGQVAGDEWEVTNLTGPGTEPHDLSLDIKQTATLAEADLVVLEHGFQPAVDETVDANAPDAEIVDAADVVELMPASEHEHEHDEAGHDHGDLDPHFWQDPLLMADLGDAVADRLAELDPDGAATYEDNAAGAAHASWRPWTRSTSTAWRSASARRPSSATRRSPTSPATGCSSRRSPASPPTPSRRRPTWPGSSS